MGAGLDQKQLCKMWCMGSVKNKGAGLLGTERRPLDAGTEGYAIEMLEDCD